MMQNLIKLFERIFQSLNANTIIYIIIGKILLFLTTWQGMKLFEPETSPFHDFLDYLWFFIVTITTVGYGDISPESSGGKWVGMILIVFGIALFGAVIGFISSSVIFILDKSRRGMMQLHERNHIVIIGYHPEKTKTLIQQLLGDKHRENRMIVLCYTADQADENPLPECTMGVKNTQGWKNTLERACLSEASRIILDLEKDSLAFELGLWVNTLKNSTSHVVVALEQVERGRNVVDMINVDFECVDSNDTSMISQACQDPGVSRLFLTLTNNLQGQVAYRSNIPKTVKSCQYGTLLHWFKTTYDALIIAITETQDLNPVIVENPTSTRMIDGGMGFYYLASERLTEIDWDKMAQS
ncbi:MAG: two pore domain potassium channel family protein [SAR324 cluster bacterium]|nr:two pore domain potassium channel family protein [SAR324 cluster bacterium]